MKESMLLFWSCAVWMMRLGGLSSPTNFGNRKAYLLFDRLKRAPLDTNTGQREREGQADILLQADKAAWLAGWQIRLCNE